MRENSTSKFTKEVYGKIAPEGVFETSCNIHILKIHFTRKRVMCLVLGPNLLGKLKIIYFLTGEVSPFQCRFCMVLSRSCT